MASKATKQAKEEEEEDERSESEYSESGATNSSGSDTSDCESSDDGDCGGPSKREVHSVDGKVRQWSQARPHLQPVSPLERPDLLKPPASRSAHAKLLLVIERLASNRTHPGEAWQPPRIFNRALDYINFQRAALAEDLLASMEDGMESLRRSIDESPFWQCALQADQADEGSTRLLRVSVTRQGGSCEEGIQRDDLLYASPCETPDKGKQGIGHFSLSRVFAVEGMWTGKSGRSEARLRGPPRALPEFKGANQVTFFLLARGTTARRELEGIDRFQAFPGRLRDAVLRPGPSTSSTPPSCSSGKDGVAEGELQVARFLEESFSCGQAQMLAVQRSALARRNNQAIMTVHGPPGTGKTETILLILSEELALAGEDRGARVKVCAPSNTAVDEVVSRLMSKGIFLRDGSRRHLSPGEVVRLGNPASISASVQEASVDALARDNESKFGRSGKKDSAALRSQIIDNAIVVASTNAGNDALSGMAGSFSLMVMDEASQATEPSSTLALDNCERAVLVGDHRQLPPTVQAPGPAGKAVGRSMFERLVECGHEPTAFLGIQYRMAPQLANLLSRLFYGGRIRSAKEAKASDGLSLSCRKGHCTLVVKSSGSRQEGGTGKRKRSLKNAVEARLARDVVEKLLADGLQPGLVGVITPYSAQQAELNGLLQGWEVEVNTIDGFQGREKDVIVITTCRTRGVGFLADERRLNVALSRARRLLVVLGDKGCLSRASHAFASLLDEAERGGFAIDSSEMDVASLHLMCSSTSDNDPG